MTALSRTDHLRTALHRYFGFDDFRDGQREVIESVLAGRDTMAVLPTGGGKTLLYQLPAYLLCQPVLVISPLLSLMQDQVDRLRRRGEKKVVMLSGAVTGKDRAELLKLLPRMHFVFASPEMLAGQQVLHALQAAKLGLFVIDEAHCISQWGPDFRPQYLLLKHELIALGHPPVLMLTATATPRVRQDILAKLGLPSAQVKKVIRSVNRPNIFLASEQLTSEPRKRRRLLQLVKLFGGQGIIYFASRRLASEMADFLNQQTKLTVAAYHAGIDLIDRYRLQQAFMNDQIDVICATSAFGMGIDKADVRYVIHYHLPGSLESYVQEIGRAGRDGQQSIAILLSSPGDSQIQQKLHQFSLPPAKILDQVKVGKTNPKLLGERQALITFYLHQGWTGQQVISFFHRRQRVAAHLLRLMTDYIQTDGCRRNFIAQYFGENLTKNAAKYCCDHDDPDWSTQGWFKPHLPNRDSSSTLHWQEHIRQLFGEKETSDR